jgi:hypothetical protein
MRFDELLVLLAELVVPVTDHLAVHGPGVASIAVAPGAVERDAPGVTLDDVDGAYHLEGMA